LNVETNQLIQHLAERAAPVGRLPAPWRRAALWFAISLPYVAAVVLTHVQQIDLAHLFADRRLLIEQSAILLTAATAVLAAFHSVIPGHDRRIVLLPVLPLAVWLAVLGEGCIGGWLRGSSGESGMRLGWECLPPAVLIGVVPTVAIVAMLRRGAPLHPRATLVLAALAVAALGNFGMRLFHPGDASLLVLLWHFGSVAVLSLLGGGAGKIVLNWSTVRAAA
jgi:hypothetical protein